MDDGVDILEGVDETWRDLIRKGLDCSLAVQG